jgi:hypothetical protein
MLLAGGCLAQNAQTNRVEIKLDPQVLARYVGVYRNAGGADMSVTLENNQLLSKLGNQNALPIFAESETMFFPKVVDAQLEFSGKDAQGRATQLTLHQGGRDQTFSRLDDAEAKRIAEFDAARQKRIKDQTATPGSEAALRGLIEGLLSGQPNYDLLNPGLANATRQQLSQLQSAVKPRGAVQSLTFKGVGPAGADIYDVKFENGSFEYRVLLGMDGKITGGQLNGTPVTPR